MKRYYGERPVLIDTQTVDCIEMMFYQDYPIKLVDSPDKYDLKGNSINPLLDYKWDYKRDYEYGGNLDCISTVIIFRVSSDNTIKIQFSGNSTFALLPVVIRLKKSIVMIEDSRKNNSQVHVNAST